MRLTAAAGVLLCLTAVGIGAFGAHALKDVLVENQRQDVFDLANRYQFYHGLALIAIAALSTQSRLKLVLVSWLLISGVLIFSGSLYLLALLNLSWLGAITPIGGVLLILGWLATLWQVLFSQAIA